MKLASGTISLAIIAVAESLFAQTNPVQRLVLPGLDPEIQSNVVVTVCDPFGVGQPCPLRYTNALSNTNLFTLEQRTTITEAFAKYKNVTTNSGPPGTVLSSLYRTNLSVEVKAVNRTFEAEDWVVRYQYTNSEAYVEANIGKSLLVRFRTKSKDGYNVEFNRTGNGTMLGFGEVKRGVVCGVLARFEDPHVQGSNWDYRHAIFTNSQLVEYRQYTNGMVHGKFLVWNAHNGRLMIEADFKQPFDWNKHYRQLR
jgi:hypothetical protein